VKTGEEYSHADDLTFTREMLPLVSRTFAPAIDILPEDLAEAVRLAYLICRVADTVEDASGIPAGIRRGWLRHFAVLLRAEPESDHPAMHLAGQITPSFPPGGPEVRLIKELPRLIRLLRDLDPVQRKVIERWTRELSLGMARFLELEERNEKGWTALATLADLEAYEYYVAGTVGCMLHELISDHLPDWRHATDARPLAVSFGLGLQGVNIIQDMSIDRARGWSYIPEEAAARHGTTTGNLTDPEERDRAMALIREMAGRSMANLDRGFEFVLALPRRVPRIRLFCMWPLLLALRTIQRITSSDEVLHRRVRISRDEVRELTSEAIAACLSNASLTRLYKRERKRPPDIGPDERKTNQ
jgi:farnesyl-diphosphate farnesyltransferase